MKKYIKNKIYWVDPIDSNQYLTVSYRKKTDADVSANYTTVTTSLLADVEGNLPEPLVISFPLLNTEYVIRYKVNGYSDTYDETVKTPLEYTILGEVDKVHQAYPSTEYTFPVSGFETAHLPTSGLFYELKDKTDPSVGIEPSLMVTGPVIFEERNGHSGIKLSNASTLSLPLNINELSVLGINDEQQSKDYTFSFWFNITSAEFSMMSQMDKIWLMYSGDQTRHFGIYIDNVTKFLTWEIKNGAQIEQSVLDTQILPDVWNKVFISKSNSGQDMAPENEFVVSFNGTDHTPTVPINFTQTTMYTGSSLNPIYLGCGKNSSGTAMVSNVLLSSLYYSDGIVGTELKNQLLNPVYPKIMCGETEITSYSYNDTEVSFSIPEDTEPGELQISVVSWMNVAVPVTVNVLPFEENETDFNIDFATTPSDARTEIVNTFLSFETQIGEGTIAPDQVYVEFGNLALEAQGNNTVSGKNNVGSGIISKGYYGYGSYKVKAVVPMSEGAVFSTWVSRDDKHYDHLNLDNFSCDWNHIVANYPTGPGNESEFREYEFKWYADRVEFYVDGDLVETLTDNIPDKVGRLGIAIWFPGEAEFMFDKVLIKSIQFEAYTDVEADGTNIVIGESFPFENLVEIGI